MLHNSSKMSHAQLVHKSYNVKYPYVNENVNKFRSYFNKFGFTSLYEPFQVHSIMSHNWKRGTNCLT